MQQGAFGGDFDDKTRMSDGAARLLGDAPLGELTTPHAFFLQNHAFAAALLRETTQYMPIKTAIAAHDRVALYTMSAAGVDEEVLDEFLEERLSVVMHAISITCARVQPIAGRAAGRGGRRTAAGRTAGYKPALVWCATALCRPVLTRPPMPGRAARRMTAEQMQPWVMTSRCFSSAVLLCIVAHKEGRAPADVLRCILDAEEVGASDASQVTEAPLAEGMSAASYASPFTAEVTEVPLAVGTPAHALGHVASDASSQMAFLTDQELEDIQRDLGLDIDMGDSHTTPSIVWRSYCDEQDGM